MSCLTAIHLALFPFKLKHKQPLTVNSYVDTILVEDDQDTSNRLCLAKMHLALSIFGVHTKEFEKLKTFLRNTALHKSKLKTCTVQFTRSNVKLILLRSLLGVTASAKSVKFSFKISLCSCMCDSENFIFY